MVVVVVVVVWGGGWQQQKPTAPRAHQMLSFAQEPLSPGHIAAIGSVAGGDPVDSVNIQLGAAQRRSRACILAVRRSSVFLVDRFQRHVPFARIARWPPLSAASFWSGRGFGTCRRVVVERVVVENVFANAVCGFVVGWGRRGSWRRDAVLRRRACTTSAGVRHCTSHGDRKGGRRHSRSLEAGILVRTSLSQTGRRWSGLPPPSGMRRPESLLTPRNTSTLDDGLGPDVQA